MVAGSSHERVTDVSGRPDGWRSRDGPSRFPDVIILPESRSVCAAGPELAFPDVTGRDHAMEPYAPRAVRADPSRASRRNLAGHHGADGDGLERSRRDNRLNPQAILPQPGIACVSDSTAPVRHRRGRVIRSRGYFPSSGAGYCIRCSTSSQETVLRTNSCDASRGGL